MLFVVSSVKYTCGHTLCCTVVNYVSSLRSHYQRKERNGNAIDDYVAYTVKATERGLDWQLG